MVRHTNEAGTLVINKGLHEIIAEHFTPHNRLELVLQKLQGLKQGNYLIDDFLMLFDNLKLDTGLSDDFALHLLLQNVSASLLKKAVLMCGEPAIYSQLQHHL